MVIEKSISQGYSNWLTLFSLPARLPLLVYIWANWSISTEVRKSFYCWQHKHTAEQMLSSNRSIQLLCFEIKWSTCLKNVFSLECTMIILNSICCNRTFPSPYNLDYAINTIVLEQMEIIKWYLATDFLSYSFANWKRRNQHLQSTKSKILSSKLKWC